jgi:hypothetical protein
MSVDRKHFTGKTFTAFYKPKLYSQNYQKAKALEFEVERNRDTIMQLKNELSNKKREIYLLKVNKNTIQDEHYKTLKTLKDFLKKSDNLTKETYKTIEKKIKINDNFEQENAKPCDENEETYINNKKKKNFKNKHKKKVKDNIKINSLRQYIYKLNEEINEKNDIITELKNNKKANEYKDLQNNFLSSCNEIKEIKRENMAFKLQVDNIMDLLIMERNDNKFLRNKLIEFDKKFKAYKEISINKVKQLDDEVNLAREKELNLLSSKNDKKKEKSDEQKDMEINEMKKKIDEYQILIKKDNDIIKRYKSTDFSNNMERKKLNNDKNDLLDQNELLKKENENMLNDIKEYQLYIDNFEKDKKKWENIEKENNDLKKEKERILKELDNLLKENEINGNSKIVFNGIENGMGVAK